ncbi:MAG: DapH/DapD/GlmU-related protein [Candidatus Omnitrophota bacterium]|nr:DapH/DapD/GlmU-related protein [Candidatus Omnitrophota bacterium]
MAAILITFAQIILVFCLYLLAAFIIGVSIFPGLLLCYYIWSHTTGSSIILRALMLSFGFSISYFIYGLTMILLVGMLRIIFRLNLKEGEYRIFSLGTIKWYIVNSLFYLVSVTFMDFILLTPIASLFYKLMGARVGKNVQINTKFGADLSLLEIDDEAVIGGHATVICHSFERSRLILKKVKIGKKAIIGLNAVILPGCEIGDGALVAAGAVLGKNKIVEPHSVYAGVPAKSAKERREREKE